MSSPEQNYFLPFAMRYPVVLSEPTFRDKDELGTPPLTRFFGPGENRVKGKPRYRRSILVLKPQNGEFEH